MTTTELITLLQKHEFGGATVRPREINLRINDTLVFEPEFKVIGTGDGMVTDITLNISGEIYRDDEEVKTLYLISEKSNHSWLPDEFIGTTESKSKALSFKNKGSNVYQIEVKEFTGDDQ